MQQNAHLLSDIFRLTSDWTPVRPVRKRLDGVDNAVEPIFRLLEAPFRRM
jgi:hypothetical protein